MDNIIQKFECGCGKKYKSYPALYTHTKLKHGGVKQRKEGLELEEHAKMKRGRPSQVLNIQIDQEHKQEIESTSKLQFIILDIHLLVQSQFQQVGIVKNDKNQCLDQILDDMSDVVLEENKRDYEKLYDLIGNVQNGKHIVDKDNIEQFLGFESNSQNMDMIMGYFLGQSIVYLNRFGIKQYVLLMILMRQAINEQISYCHCQQRNKIQEDQSSETITSCQFIENIFYDECFYEYLRKIIMEYCENMKEMKSGEGNQMLESIGGKIIEISQREQEQHPLVSFMKQFCEWMNISKFTSWHLEYR